MSRTRNLKIGPVGNLAAVLGGGQLVAFNVSQDGTVYLVIALKPLDYRFEGSGGATFAKTVADRPMSYRVVGVRDEAPVLDVVIDGERFNIHDVQPLGDEILLVCGRSRYRGKDDFDKNGRVYTRDGTFVRAMLLGDAIQTVQTTSKGVIWTSYFDEGISGNFGWNDPVGRSGLVAWDAQGNKLFEHEPGPGLDIILDCYALNVASDEDVWCYYYTEFPLVHLRSRKIRSSWKMPVRGSDAFAVSAGYALFRGGYGDPTYHLFSLRPDGAVSLVERFELCDTSGQPLVPDYAVGRGSSLHLLRGDELFRLDLRSTAGLWDG